MFLKKLQISILLSLVCSLFACKGNNNFTAPEPSPPEATHEKKESHDKKEEGLKPPKPKQFTLEEFVGVPLFDYPSLTPAKGQFAAEAFNRSKEFAAKKKCLSTKYPLMSRNLTKQLTP